MWILYALAGLAIAIVVVLIVYFLGKAIRHSDTYVSYHQRAKERYGRYGELYVAEQLKDIADAYNGYLVNGLCFQDDDGFSSEIDHILVTRGGVFVIETKTFKGKIYGYKEDDYWTCVKKSFQENRTFRNPVMQNQGHINHLKKVLRNNSPKMISMVVFLVADLTDVFVDEVFTIEEAVEYIIKITEENHYSQRFVERMAKEFETIRNRYGISHEKHVENIKMYH